MNVTCKATGEKVNKKNAFAIKLWDHKNNTHFKSEEVYNNWVLENASKENIPILYNKILGLGQYHKQSGVFNKKLEKWLVEFSCFEIEFCLEHFMDVFKKYRSKGQPYLVSVIDNKLYQARDIFRLKNNSNSKVIEIIETDVENKINNYKFKRKNVDFRGYDG